MDMDMDMDMDMCMYMSHVMWTWTWTWTWRYEYLFTGAQHPSPRRMPPGAAGAVSMKSPRVTSGLDLKYTVRTHFRTLTVFAYALAHSNCSCYNVGTRRRRRGSQHAQL